MSFLNSEFSILNSLTPSAKSQFRGLVGNLKSEIRNPKFSIRNAS